jgi:hypothetical protein
MKQRARQILRDVHRIALTYHWNEKDILSLAINRRLAYLKMIRADEDAAAMASFAPE